MEGYKSKCRKKLFSIYRVYDHEAENFASMMHVYNRNLSPIKENFQTCNPLSPYEANFSSVFSP